MAGTIINRQMTPEEAKLHVSASAVQLAEALSELTENPKLLTQLGADAAASLKITDDLSAQWQQAQSDIASANALIQANQKAQTDLDQAKQDWATQLATAQAKLAADQQAATDAAVKKQADLDSQAEYLNNYNAQLTIQEQKLSNDHDALMGTVKQYQAAADAKVAAMQAQTSARNAELDKREADLVAREAKVADLKAALAA